MKLTIHGALYTAGAILITAAIVSQFQRAELIWSTLTTLSVLPILYFGYRAEQKKKRCLPKKNKPLKMAAVTLGIAFVFLGFGFTVGKLIYLWAQ